MSTIPYTNVTPHATPSSDTIDRHFSLHTLLQTLSDLQQTPTQNELNRWLQKLELEMEALRPHLGFKAGTYVRHRVFRNQWAELLVLCWRPGQRTAIHDHNGSYGAIRVCEGMMEETMFALDEARELSFASMRMRSCGEVAGTDIPDIHRIGNHEESGQDLVTMHIYAPPLRVINTYRLGSSEVGQYMPDDQANTTKLISIK